MLGTSGAGAAGGVVGGALFGAVAVLVEELGEEANESGVSGPSIKRAMIKQATKALETAE
jgi:hypothetical protein